MTKQNDSAFNESALAPGIPFPERGRQVYDEIVAIPAHNRRTHHRSGPRQAEEGLGWEPSYSSAFVGGIAATDSGAAHAAYESQIAGQAYGRGRLGSGQHVPAWDAVPQESLDGFADGASGDQGRATPYPWAARHGARRPITALEDLNSAFSRGERQNTTYVSTIASNPRSRRRNAADVSDQ
jgi:hypothetical protein